MKLYNEYTNTENCDCEYERLIDENNNELLSGDYYHNKINYQIKGYLQALKDNNIEFDLKIKEINCPWCKY